jgi:hypothetical protein
VALSAVVRKDEPWDESTTQLVQDLDEIGVRLKGSSSLTTARGRSSLP